MSQPSENESPTVFLRVYSKPDGKTFLLFESANQEVEINAPITRENIEEARRRLIVQTRNAFELEREQLEGNDEASATPQQQANRQIRNALEPRPKSYLEKLKQGSLSVHQALIALMAIWVMVAVFYKGVELSQEHLPEKLHFVVLALYLFGIALCIYLMATDKKRRKENDRIQYWFGPRGMLVLPCLTLVSAAAVFASITLSLHRHGLVALQECTGRPVSSGSLTDFYMWHFMKLVPLVKINELLKLNEPLCYSQKRIGLFILIFQTLVVIPSINTVLYYWKNRHILAAPPYDYRYEAGWEPVDKKTD